MSIKWSLIVFSILVFVSNRTFSQNVDHCIWKSKTNPNPLIGYEGNSYTNDYWFSHLSDVDVDVNGLNQYIFKISNKHPNNFLSCGWIRSNGIIQIYFRRVAPGKCASNSYLSSNPYKEDLNSKIAYGEKKQFEKQSPMYVVDTASLGKKIRLTSKIYVDLERNEKLDIEFTSSYEDGTFMYSITNTGSNSYFCSIPTLFNAWSSFSQQEESMELNKNWLRYEGRFPAPATKEPSRFNAYISSDIGFSEHIAQISILSNDGELMANGIFTLFLPNPK